MIKDADHMPASMYETSRKCVRDVQYKGPGDDNVRKGVDVCARQKPEDLMNGDEIRSGCTEVVETLILSTQSDETDMIDFVIQETVHDKQS